MTLSLSSNRRHLNYERILTMPKIHISTTTDDHYETEAESPEAVWHTIQAGGALSLLSSQAMPGRQAFNGVLNPVQVVMVSESS